MVGNYLSSARNPACSKWRSPVSASVIPAFRIAANEMQSVSDHALSGRWRNNSKPCSNKSVAGPSTCTSGDVCRRSRSWRKVARFSGAASASPNSVKIHAVVTIGWLAVSNCNAFECASSRLLSSARKKKVSAKIAFTFKNASRCRVDNDRDWRPGQKEDFFPSPPKSRAFAERISLRFAAPASPAISPGPELEAFQWPLRFPQQYSCL